MNLKELLQRSTGSTRWYEVPSIKVSCVDEYFALPKSEREWFGFYKLPVALPWELIPNRPNERGWDSFYEQISKEYPIQYFFRRWCFSADNPIFWVYRMYLWWPLRNFYYATKRWCKPLHPRWRACLPRHEYCDISELIARSNYALIQDFYWEEMVDGFVDWDGDDQHKEFYKQIKGYVEWIEKNLPKLKEDCSNALIKASESKETDYKTKYAEFNRLEKVIYDKETEILEWLANNRGFFWT